MSDKQHGLKVKRGNKRGDRKHHRQQHLYPKIKKPTNEAIDLNEPQQLAQALNGFVNDPQETWSRYVNDINHPDLNVSAAYVYISMLRNRQNNHHIMVPRASFESFSMFDNFDEDTVKGFKGLFKEDCSFQVNVSLLHSISALSLASTSYSDALEKFKNRNLHELEPFSNDKDRQNFLLSLALGYSKTSKPKYLAINQQNCRIENVLENIRYSALRLVRDLVQAFDLVIGECSRPKHGCKKCCLSHLQKCICDSCLQIKRKSAWVREECKTLHDRLSTVYATNAQSWENSNADGKYVLAYRALFNPEV